MSVLRSALHPSGFIGTLDIYLMRMFFMRFVLLLLLIVTILQMLDLLNNSEDVLAAEGATSASLVRYVLLRAPQLISQFAPFVALMASVLILAELNYSSEITVIQAAGCSVRSLVVTLMLACAPLAIVHFAFHELVVVESTARFSYWEDNDFAIDLPSRSELASDVWVVADSQLVVHAQGARRSDDETWLYDLTIYERDPDGLLERSTRAAYAVYEERQWTLYDVSRFDVEGNVSEHVPTHSWRNSLSPDPFFFRNAEAQWLNLGELMNQFRGRENGYFEAGSLQTNLFRRFAAPLASIIMPLLAAATAFGVRRTGMLFARILLGTALGFSFLVAENLMLAVGELGASPPLVAAFTPVVLFSLIGIGVLFYMEEG